MVRSLVSMRTVRQTAPDARPEARAGAGVVAWLVYAALAMGALALISISTPSFPRTMAMLPTVAGAPVLGLADLRLIGASAFAGVAEEATTAALPAGRREETHSCGNLA